VQVITGWDATADVTTPAAVVTVQGTAQSVDTVEVSRELASALPGTVIGGGGLTGATGTVTWSQPRDVETRAATPWAPSSGLPPAGGAKVSVAMGDERGTCTMLTGLVDASSGTFANGKVISDLVDVIDRLNQPITMQPLINAMPPLVPGNVARYVGLSGVWVADRVLRTCGFYATPPNRDGTVVSVTAMGSMWPELGEVTACRASAGLAFPGFPSAPWGQCAQDVDATYTPETTRALDGPLEILMQWPGSTAGNPYVWVQFGAVGIRLALTAANVFVQTMNGSTATNVASVTRGAATRAIARVTPSGSSITIELRTDTGGSTAATVTPPAGLLANAMTGVRVVAANTSRIGPVQVRLPAGAAFQDLTHQPTALFELGASIAAHSMQVLPALLSRDALELLKEHARAVCAALWLDEHGRVRWVAREVLGAGAPVRTLTSTHDLLDAEWSDEWREVYSRALVQWSEVSITRASRDTVTLWEGGGGIDAGDLITEFARPGSGEDWVMVDTSMSKMGPAADSTEYNYGIGSFTGATVTDGTTETWASTDVLDTSVRRVDWRTYGVFTAVNTVPSGKRANMQGPSDFGDGVWSARFGQKLPVLRGRAKFELSDTRTYSETRGPSDAAVYTHEAGWWVQTEAQALALADWIATTATVRTPQLSDVEVVFDPRLQLGDRVVLEDPHRSGLRVVGVIFGLTQRVGVADASTNLTLRVLEVAQLNPTLDQYDTVWSGATLSQRDAQWSGKTLADFDAAPLTRS
jgi:hypothetical protein